MGYAARANKSAEKAAAAGHIKGERVTVARVRRQRLAELRNHLASMVAMQVIAGMRDDNARREDAALMQRMTMQRGGPTLIRHTDDADREIVSWANALQRIEPDHSTFTEHDVSGALAGVTRHEDRPLTPQEG